MQQKKEYYTLTVILMMLRSKGFAAWKYTQKRWDMDTKLQLVRQAKQGNAQSFAVLFLQAVPGLGQGTFSGLSL